MFSKKSVPDLSCLSERIFLKGFDMDARLLKHTIRVIGLGVILVVGLLVGCSETEDIPTSPATNEGSYALIYNGPVAAEDGPEAVAAIAKQAGLSVMFVSDIAELPHLLNDAAVFIIGGTEDDLDPLKDAFTPDVTAALEAYLRDGGRYWGICGGGYLASTGWEEDEIFVEMLALVPAESSEFDENDEPQMLPIQWLGETRSMYFQFGPAFDLTDSQEDVNVFAYYDDGRIAGLISSYGDGKVAVCGPHPEARESWSDEATNGDEWISTTDLAVALLQDLLSDDPVDR